MKKINIILVLLIFTFSAASLFSIDTEKTAGSSAGDYIKVGAAGSQFMKIGIGARGNGMAGAYGSVVNDLSSIYWNPAGLAEVKGITGNFSYTSWFADFQHNFAAISMPLGSNFTVAVSMISFSSDNIEITTIEKPEGTGLFYNVNDVAAGASVSGYLTDQFSFGVTAKYIYNSFASLSSGGIAFDIGTMYETGIQGIKLGFSIHNLGAQLQYQGQDLYTTKRIWDALSAQKIDASYTASSYSIPLIFRAGISAALINTESSKLISAFDFVTNSDTKEQYALGFEYTWRNFVSVRAGYRFGLDQIMGIAGGVGLKYDGGAFAGSIDYSVNPTYDIGLINRLSVTVGMK